MPEGENRLGPVRINNTVRIAVPEHRREEVSLDYFVQKILFGLLELDARKVLFFQHHVSSAVFEVSLVTGELFRRVKKTIADNLETPLLRDLEFSSSDGYASVIVQVYTPLISTDDIALFLSRYCLEVRDGARLTNKYGLFTGRRRFRVRFKTKPDGTTVYPPYMFFLGAEKGFLFVEGQPGACWRCGAVGHRMADCNKRGCRFCGSAEHFSNACPAPKTCSTCGSESHLFKDCPRRSRNVGDGTKDDGGHAASATRPHGPERTPALPPVATVEDDSAERTPGEWGEALGEDGARELPPVDGGESAGRVAQEPPLVDGGQVAASEVVGEAPGVLAAQEAPQGAPGAADPAASATEGDIDSLVGRGIQQTTQDVFGTPPSSSFGTLFSGADLATPPALRSTESGQEEEMPCLGPSAKRDHPSDEDSDGSIRKEQRTCVELSSSSEEPAGASDSGDFSDCSALEGDVQERPAPIASADLVAADSVTKDQVAEAQNWSVEDASTAEPATDQLGSRAPGPVADPGDGRRSDWPISPSVESTSSPEMVAPSPVFGSETSHPPQVEGRGASRPSRLPRRVGESALTVGRGRGEKASAPVRSLRGGSVSRRGTSFK